jgi:hypothetical protein
LNRPFPLPEDVGLNGRVRPAQHLFRAVACVVRSASERGSSPESVARRLYPRDEPTQLLLRAAAETDDKPTRLLLRAATGPATTTGANWATSLAQTATRDFIASLTSFSAGAEVLGRGLQVGLGNWAEMFVPGRVLDVNSSGTWLAEGQPVTVRPLTTIQGANLLPRKLVVITSYTMEMANASLIEDIIRQTVAEASALALDAALFGTQADNGAIPKGLLNGVTAITGTAAATPPNPIAAFSADLKNLFAALASNGAGRNAILVAAVPQFASLKTFAGPQFDFETFASQPLAAGTLIALEPSSLVCGIDPVPEFSVGVQPTLHMETATPQDVTGGTPSPAVPIKSMFQVDSIALRMILRVAWGLRANGHAQWIQGATW